MIRQGRAAILVLFLLACALPGCDGVTRHKIMTTVFDGYPDLPAPEELCEQYVEMQAAVSAEEADTVGEGQQRVREDSRHLPYEKKRCNDCHDKQKEDGLIRPPQELCFVCHQDFIQGKFVHGPVAVGDCLACHLPHTANFAPLLKESKSRICSVCHQEKRLAAGMHDKVGQNRMDCVDCHHPHFGNAKYFLK